MSFFQMKLIHRILVVLGCWLFAGLAWSQNTAPALFSSSTITPSVRLKHEPEVVKVRQVFVDTALLTARASEIGKSPLTPQELTLNLFEDVQLIADLERVEPTLSGMVWVGRLREAGFSRVTITVAGNLVSGNIVSSAGRYLIRPVSEGVHEVQKIDASLIKYAQTPPLIPPPSLAPSTLAYALPGIAADDDTGKIIDVMVVYTSAAVSGAGSLNNLLADINQAVTDTNQAFADSGVSTRIRLVRTEQVTYTETTVTDALNHLTGTTDTYMDNVHTLRTTYGADLVSLWVAADSYSSEECGAAHATLAYGASASSYAFSVVTRSCANTNYGFAHQLGYNLGAWRDAYVTPPGASPYPAYAQGYSNLTLGTRTIMAMENECEFALGISCTRMPLWSNLIYPNYGNATTADNARRISETAATVAAFKTSVAIGLTSGLEVSLYGVANSEAIYKITVPASALGKNLAISISGGSGDADLYVRRGSIPTAAAYDCRPYAIGSSTESCVSITPSGETVYYIMVKGYTDFSGVTMTATYSDPEVLVRGSSTTASGPTGSQKLYKITVPTGASNLVITTSGGTGNVNLYAKSGSAPTTSSSDCSSTNSGNAETCTVATPVAGDYYILLNGVAAYSGVSLLANYTKKSNITPILMLLLE